jgi:hypothetical protein
MIDDAQTDRAALLVLQAARRFARGRQDVGVRPGAQGLHETESIVADLGIGRDFGRVAAQQREVMIALETPDGAQPILGRLAARRAYQ